MQALVWGGGALSLAVLTEAHLPQLRYLTDRDLHLTALALGTAALPSAAAGTRSGTSGFTSTRTSAPSASATSACCTWPAPGLKQ